MSEQWRPVLGWEGLYEVSDQGRVRSVTRTVQSGYGSTRTVRGRVLVGPQPDLEARHLDGDPSNNALSNLAWGTAVENWADRYQHGTGRWALARGACIHGHPYDEANTYLDRKGRPRCRTCRREGMRRRAA